MDLSEIKAGDAVAREVFLVAEANLLKDRRGQDYYDLVLGHLGGRSIRAKVWSDRIGEAIAVGDFLQVTARADDRFGLQLDVQRYAHADPATIDAAAYVRCAEIDTEAAFEEVFHWGDGRSENRTLTALMGQFHDNAGFAQRFKTAPAAVMHHHNYTGGLVEHTHEVYRLCRQIGEFYAERVDMDVLLAAAGLHDIGKIHTYRLVVGVSQKTDEGYLLDHVYISASMVSNLWKDLPGSESEGGGDAQLKNRVLHAILAHHGKLEWGAPVLPQTPEALILNFADHISATMKSTFEAIGEKGDEDWTKAIYVMDAKRRIFSPGPPGADRGSET